MGRLAQEHVKWLQARPSVGNAVWKAETGENKKIENVTLAVSLVSPVFRIWRKSGCWPLQIVSRARSLALIHVCTDSDVLLNTPTPPAAPPQKKQLLILKGVSFPKENKPVGPSSIPTQRRPLQVEMAVSDWNNSKVGQMLLGLCPTSTHPTPNFYWSDLKLMLLIKLQKL